MYALSRLLIGAIRDQKIEKNFTRAYKYTAWRKKDEKSGGDVKVRQRWNARASEREAVVQDWVRSKGLWTDVRTLFLVFGGMTVPLQSI